MASLRERERERRCQRKSHTAEKGPPPHLGTVIVSAEEGKGWVDKPLAVLKTTRADSSMERHTPEIAPDFGEESDVGVAGDLLANGVVGACRRGGKDGHGPASELACGGEGVAVHWETRGRTRSFFSLFPSPAGRTWPVGGVHAPPVGYISTSSVGQADRASCHAATCFSWSRMRGREDGASGNGQIQACSISPAGSHASASPSRSPV